MRRSVVRSHPRLPIRDADLAQWESTPLWTGICRFDSGRRCQYRFSSEVRAAGSNPARRGFESFSRCQLFWTFATQRVLTQRLRLERRVEKAAVPHWRVCDFTESP